MSIENERLEIIRLAEDLAEEWGITGKRKPIGKFDGPWMQGYSAACRQIVRAIEAKGKDDGS